MNRTLRGLLLFVCAGVLSAWSQPQAAQQPAGLESDWDIAAVLQNIGAHATRLLPLLDRADAGAWKTKGAPPAYVAQLQSSKDQAHALVDDVKALSANPEMLSAALQLLFREQGLKTIVGSVVEAMRKYQSADAAQELIAAAAEADADRERLESYIVNLAAEREKEYQVMDREAQRCRAIVLGPATVAKKKK